MKKGIAILGIVFACAILIFLGAIESTTFAGENPKYGGTLKVGYDNPPQGSIGWPPEIFGDATAIPQMVIEGLLREDHEGELHPWLAESYKIADDLRSITFNLRKGVKFHDGSIFNAEAARWNLENSIRAKLTPYWASIDIVDDYAIRVNFYEWRNTHLRGFDSNAAWMISKEAFDKHGLDWVRYNPVGTGPFKFVSFARDTSFKTVRNPDYWQKGKPYLEALEVVFLPDVMTRRAAIEAGAVDAATFEPSKITRELEEKGFTFKVDMIATSGLIPDTVNADSPWTNKKVREAAEYAIDREAIAKGMGHGYWKPAYQIPGPDTKPYNPDFKLGRKYDPEKAKRLLAEAGYPNGFKTTIIACPFSLIRDVAVAVQGYFAKVGIQADLEFPNPPGFMRYLMGTWNNAVIYEPVAGFPNYNVILSFLFGLEEITHKGWARTPEFVAAFKASLASPTVNTELIRAVTDLMTKEALFIPVNESGRGWVIQPYVMDAGFLDRGLSPFFKPDQAWLNK